MPVLVGRAGELEVLGRALDDARAGHGAVVLVGGPAGIGKTSLVDEVARQARAAGMPVLRGRAMAEEGMPALWPWWQALQPYPELVARLDGIGAGAALAPEVSRGERLRGFETLLRELAGVAPSVVVVLEDVHWADESSLRMLGLSAGRAGLVVVATYRDNEQGEALRAAVTQLRRDRSTVAVALRPLGVADVSAIVDGVAHASWVPLLVRTSGGNPLYVNEMMGALVDAGLAEAPAPESGVWPLGVPEQLRGIVLDRLSRLDDQVRDVVQASAVVGADSSVRAVVRLCGVAPEAVLGAVGAAGGLLVLVGGQGIRFEHELVREAVYATVPAERAVGWHHRLADAIEAGELPGESVTHRLRSIVDEESRDAAVRACRAAAELSMGRLAFDRATELLDAALDAVAGEEHPDRVLVRCELLLEAAGAEFAAGLVEAALRRCVAASELAGRVGRPDLLARAALLVRGVVGTVSGTIMRLCDRALAALPESASVWRARVMAQRALVAVDAISPDEAGAPSLEALELAERTGDPLALVDALRARQEVLAHPSGVAGRLEVARRMLELGPAAPPDSELWARLWRIDAGLQLGSMSTVDDELTRLELLADRLGWPIAHWHLHKLRSARDILLGRFDSAEREAQLMLAAGQRTDDITTVALVIAVRAELCDLQGRNAELRERVQWMLDAGPPMPVVQSFAGLFLLDAGDVDVAWQCLGGVRPALSALPRDGRWFPVMCQTGLLAAALGDLDVTRHCYTELLPCAAYYIAAGSGTLLCLGSASRPLGTMAATLGMTDEAARHFTEAIAMDNRIGALPYRTLSEIGLAGVLCDAEPERAATLARNAATTARRLGMQPALRRADELLRRAERARREAVPLTTREREILIRLARGASNRAIAEELVLSERTVETHVRNVLAKLGVTNRAQAGRWAVEHGFT